MNPWNDPQIAHRNAMERGSKELLAALCATYPNIRKYAEKAAAYD